MPQLYSGYLKQTNVTISVINKIIFYDKLQKKKFNQQKMFHRYSSVKKAADIWTKTNSQFLVKI